jgi:hypothetical protein
MYTFFSGGDLPPNVAVHSQQRDPDTESCLMLVAIDETYPLPFNGSVGEISIAGIWGEDGGVLTALFTDIDILESKYEFIALHTVPVVETSPGEIMTLFAEQDIVIGEGSDTLLRLNMTNPHISLETERLEEHQPGDAFAIVHQNTWFISVDQNETAPTVYDDDYSVTGGGQIAEATSSTGGILYHAMIDAHFVPSACELNPLSGVGFIQNLKVGEDTDLGHIFLNFHETCDGKAFVELASGKYIWAIRGNVDLDFY